MNKYIISYDVLGKNEEDTCEEISSSDFRNLLIEILCENNARKISWENQTTISFESKDNILKSVADALDELDICLDFHLSRIGINSKGKALISKRNSQKDSIESFKEDVRRICKRSD